jgi:hypothetical protein
MIPNHLLELALHRAGVDGSTGSHSFFRIPDTFAATRFGLDVGRYFIDDSTGFVRRASVQNDADSSYPTPVLK